MKVEILHHPGDDNYSWKLWTGPDGIDFYDGLVSSLGEAFEEIIKHEIWSGIDYCGEKL
jgi:hypothetical protein